MKARTPRRSSIVGLTRLTKVDWAPVRNFIRFVVWGTFVGIPICVVPQSVNPSSSCPTINVSCPSTVDVDSLMRCYVRVSDTDRRLKLKFRWTVSAGVITKGQNTPAVTIDTSGLFPATIEAKIEIDGLRIDSCPKAASAYSTLVIVDPGAVMFVEYGDISIRKESAYLDKFAVRLRKEPLAQSYIIVYAGKRAWVDEAKKRAVRLRGYLVEKHRIDPERVVAIDGGYRQSRTVELWLVPPGAQPPSAAPTLDPREVQILKHKREVETLPNPD